MLGRRKKRSAEGPAMYERLREMALDAVALGMPPPPPEHARVAGAVIDIPADGGYATVVAMTDNSTSMYTSVGGGTIGAGEHEAVAAATHALLATIDGHLDEFAESDDTAQPAAGTVRVFALTPTGRRVADMPDDIFWIRSQGPQTPVAMAAQGVIAALRQASG